MHYRHRSVLFAAPGLVIGAVAVGATGGITLGDFEKPELLIASLFVGFIIGMAVEELRSMNATAGVANKKPITLGEERHRGQHCRCALASDICSGAAETI